MSGVTDTGFVAATESEIFDAIAAEARATIAPTLDTSPDSVFGQLAGIVAAKQAELWEVLEAVYGALNVNGSGGALDRIAAITGSVRKDGESDAVFRLRRVAELSAAGSTTSAALHAALSELSGVTAVRVYSNRSMSTDSAGRPAKSVEAVVFGGAAQAVVDTVWAHLAAGIETYGTSTGSVTDEEGNAQTVRYSPATAVSLYVRLSLVTNADYGGEETVKARIVAFSRGEFTLTGTTGSALVGATSIGDTLYRYKIAAAALTVPGVVALQRVEFSLDGAAWTDADYALGPRALLASGTTLGFVPEHVVVVAA